MHRDLPVIEDVSLREMYDDPYPFYARLREEAPIAWIAPANIALVTRFDDIITIERDHETFPASDLRSLQIRAMGRSLMRRDGEDHAAERSVLTKSFNPVVVKSHWAPIFTEIAEELVATVAPRGQGDLFHDFAAPMAARALAEVIGIPDVEWRDMLWWSQALIDATGNYADDPEPWERCDRAAEGIHAAIDRNIIRLKANPDPSPLSAMVQAGWPIEKIRANVKVVIGGGLNEPRDSIGTTVLGLLSDPAQAEAYRADPKLARPAFEEAVRWIAPIGMYPRKVARDTVLSDTLLPAGTAIGLSAASACRDESKFGSSAERYDLFRPKAQHLAFGSGPHFCLGTWMARMMVGEIAVPLLFDRLPGLRLDPERPARLGGWVFRGPLDLPVQWDATA